jgi:deoxyuridine 5'-triphosphate nucleotidohydrolase
MLRYARVDDNSFHLSRATASSAGLDLRAISDQVIPARQRQLVQTGIAIECPPGTYARIAPRSSLALDHIDVAAGVVDPDFRGAVVVLLVNCSDADYTIHRGQKVAQLIIERYCHVEIEEASTLESTERGEACFGSSGR